MNILALIGFIFLAGLLIWKFIELWILKDEETSIRRSLERFEARVANESPEWLVLIPIHYGNIFLDCFLGTRLFSKKIFKVVSLISLPLVISSVLLLGIVGKDEKARELTPWEMYALSLKSLEMNLEAKELRNDPNNAVENEVKEMFKRRIKFLLSLNTPFWHVVYTIAYILLCSVITAVLGLISFSTTRQFAREMMYAKGALTLLSGAFLNLVMILIIGSAFTLIVTLFSMPALWPSFDALFLMPQLGLFWSSLIFSAISALGWFLIIPSWTKVIIVISLIPWIGFALLLLLGSISYVLKRPIYLTVSRLLKRSLEWRSGPIGFVIAVFTFLTALVAFISEYFF